MVSHKCPNSAFFQQNAQVKKFRFLKFEFLISISLPSVCRSVPNVLKGQCQEILYIKSRTVNDVAWSNYRKFVCDRFGSRLAWRTKFFNSLPNSNWLAVGKIRAHCTANQIYVFPKMKLRGLVPNSYIHVSVSDFYIFQDRSRIHECGNWETEHYNSFLEITRLRSFISGNSHQPFSCSAVWLASEDWANLLMNNDWQL
jgi:hypothetical protein